VADVPGPISGDADDQPTGRGAGADLGLPGDADLNKLAGVPSSKAFDATVLEFDFVPMGGTVSLQFALGSTEYNGTLPPDVTDSFAVFLNGQPVSLVPGTNTPVGVGTVNLQTNSQFFNDNSDDDFNEFAGPLPTVLSGVTKVLTATGSASPGAVNHLKIAVEDTTDPLGDTVVFVKANSFTATSPLGLKPFRYVFHPSTGTYDGNVTVLNVTDTTIPGPFAIAFENLPTHVTLVNATGTAGGGTTGLPVVPAISLPGLSSLPVLAAVRTPVKFTNPPPPVFLSTFFEGYVVDLLNGKAAQGVT
jgi:hypothetical protein